MFCLSCHMEKLLKTPLLSERKPGENKMSHLIKNSYNIIIGFFENYFKDFFLFAMRAFWGYQFFLTGRGKFQNIENVVGFFDGLGIPFATFNAYLVASVEFFGGLLLLIGLASRLVSLPLLMVMLTAYFTAHIDAVKGIFSGPDQFIAQDPFLFMLTLFIVLIFGPGKFSVDRLVEKFKRAKTDVSS